MPANSYDEIASGNIPGAMIAPGGTVKPGSDLEDNSVAAGQGAAFMDIMDEAHADHMQHRSEHGGSANYGDESNAGMDHDIPRTVDMKNVGVGE